MGDNAELLERFRMFFDFEPDLVRLLESELDPNKPLTEEERKRLEAAKRGSDQTK